MNLKKKSFKGVAWNGAGNAVRQLLMIVTLIVMARFLTPQDFGRFAILMVFVEFMNIFSSMGTSQIIIHMSHLSQRMLSTLFYLNVIFGFFIFLLLYFLSKPIAIFFDDLIFIDLVKVVGLNYILLSLVLVQKALLEKKIQFKKVVLIESLSLVIGSACGILSAINGLGIYSLLIMTLVKTMILSFGFWVSSKWRPSLHFSLIHIKEVWSFSSNLMAFSTVNYFSRSSDNFLIGKFLGAQSLGYYSLAYKIMLYPLENVARVIVRVMFPIFSSIQDDNIRFKRGYLKTITVIAIITFPVMAGLFSISDNFVHVFLGEDWKEMSAIIVILAPVGLVQSIVTTTGCIYMAKGTTNILFKMGLLNAIVVVLFFLVGIPYGLKGVAFAYAIANLMLLYPNLFFAWKQIDLTVMDGLKALLPIAIVSLLMSVLVYFLGMLYMNVTTSKFLVLVTQVLLGGVFYIFCMFMLNKKNIISVAFDIEKGIS